MTYSIQQIR
ncbi:Protein of unknown function [Lactobacillus delbrueckii subsp. lactis]|nr:Protein of unknown function [Lactobacillus delbrueckii subsp. lactis]